MTLSPLPHHLKKFAEPITAFGTYSPVTCVCSLTCLLVVPTTAMFPQFGCVCLPQVSRSSLRALGRKWPHGGGRWWQGLWLHLLALLSLLTAPAPLLFSRDDCNSLCLSGNLPGRPPGEEAQPVCPWRHPDGHARQPGVHSLLRLLPLPGL